MNLASLLSRGSDASGLGRARRVLERALEQDLPGPGVEGELAYSLGLLRAEQQDLIGAIEPLQRAAALSRSRSPGGTGGVCQRWRPGGTEIWSGRGTVSL